MLDLNDLYYFARVVERGGFTAASRATGIGKSLLSRRIQTLERTLGVLLIRRNSRRFAVTEIGAEFYEQCRAVTIEAEEAENVVRRRLAEPAGRVRFTCPTVLGQHVIAGLLPHFLEQHAKIEVVQRLTGADMELLDEGFDLALRIHGPPLPPSSLVQRTVCPIRQVLVAAPSFLDRNGRPSSPAALQGVVGLARNPFDSEPHWALTGADGTAARIGFRPVFFSNDWLTLATVAVSGIGVVALPAHVCRDALAGGTLERLLPDWHLAGASLSLLSPSRRGTLPAVRALADYLIAELPAALG